MNTQLFSLWALKRLAIFGACAVLPVVALAEKQTFKATIGGTAFESDDDGILYLLPVKGTLNLQASTKGASAYPPPKTPIDKFSFVCRGFEGKPVVLSFKSGGCELKFTKNVSQKMGGDPSEKQHFAVGGKNQSFEVTAVRGEIIEGKFRVEVKEAAPGSAPLVIEGSFKAEDRQL
jgi:hypothetical protein